MEINPNTLRRNPDIVQTLKRVSSSVFFLHVCLMVPDITVGHPVDIIIMSTVGP